MRPTVLVCSFAPVKQGPRNREERLEGSQLVKGLGDHQLLSPSRSASSLWVSGVKPRSGVFSVDMSGISPGGRTQMWVKGKQASKASAPSLPPVWKEGGPPFGGDSG